MKSLEVLRLEGYLRFHLAEILEKMKSNDEEDSNADLTWSAKWGSSAQVLKECLLRSREEICLALARLREGTYGTCVSCGNEIDLRRLEVVPWARVCVVCNQESDRQHQRGEIVL